MTTETVQTIASQIDSIPGMHPSTQLITVDENTLRVHTKRGRTVRNIDIRYDRGTDLYTVSVHTFSAPKYEVKTEVTEMVFADALPEFFPDRVVLNLVERNGPYAVKCDACKRDIRRTDSLAESAAGGRCGECS
jgi:hypothetical protein